MSPIRTIHVGLGPIGLQIVDAAADSTSVQPVAAADIFPSLAGKSLGELTGRNQLDGVEVLDSLEGAIEAAGATGGADVVVLSSSSKVSEIAPQTFTAVGNGLNVVSTSEELTWPWLRHPDLADEIHQAACDGGVTVVGTGINPGFLLDLLPLLLCRPCRAVRRVTASRIVNVSLRRKQLQAKVGSGLDVETYRNRASQGSVGHVGLGESAAMIAGGLGWSHNGVDETTEPVIAKEPMETEHFSIEPGQVIGSHQTAIINSPDGKVVELICRMTHGEPDPRDEVIIDGDPPVHMRIEGGIFGDTATAGCTINILPQVLHANPGLLTVKDLPII